MLHEPRAGSLGNKPPVYWVLSSGPKRIQGCNSAARLCPKRPQQVAVTAQHRSKRAQHPGSSQAMQGPLPSMNISCCSCGQPLETAAGTRPDGGAHRGGEGEGRAKRSRLGGGAGDTARGAAAVSLYMGTAARPRTGGRRPPWRRRGACKARPPGAGSGIFMPRRSRGQPMGTAEGTRPGRRARFVEGEGKDMRGAATKICPGHCDKHLSFCCKQTLNELWPGQWNANHCAASGLALFALRATCRPPKAPPYPHIYGQLLNCIREYMEALLFRGRGLCSAGCAQRRK